MKAYEVKDHAASLLPEGKEWKLVWSDEFDGTELDKSKWDFRREIMGTRHAAWCGEEGIELDGNSNCVFRMIEKDGMICSTQLQTGYNYMDAVKDDAGTKYSGGLNWPIAPLKQAKDAVKLDTSDLSIEEVICRMKQIVQEKIPV